MSLIDRIVKRPGLPPGSVVFVGEKKLDRPRIQVIDYDEAHLEERELATIEEAFPYKDKGTISWINIYGIHDTEMIKKLGDHYGFHPLMLEDVANTTQRPKLEDFGDYIYIALKAFGRAEGGEDLDVEHMSFVLGKDYVITFQERVGDFFEPVRERIRSGKGRIRKMGADYLAYALIDALVDSYFVVLERIGERIEALDDELMDDPRPETLEAIHVLKRDAITLRRSIWPLREVASSLDRGESPLLRKQTHVFLRDLYDHTIQVIDTIESYRDIVSGLTDLYLSVVSNRMNEIMKVLTIIATIFIPLTFIAGIYGMNFAYMPELGVRWAYFAVWGVIIVVGIVMLAYFRRLRWI